MTEELAEMVAECEVAETLAVKPIIAQKAGSIIDAKINDT